MTKRSSSPKATVRRWTKTSQPSRKNSYAVRNANRSLETQIKQLEKLALRAPTKQSSQSMRALADTMRTYVSTTQAPLVDKTVGRGKNRHKSTRRVWTEEAAARHVRNAEAMIKAAESLKKSGDRSYYSRSGKGRSALRAYHLAADLNRNDVVAKGFIKYISRAYQGEHKHNFQSEIFPTVLQEFWNGTSDDAEKFRNWAIKNGYNKDDINGVWQYYLEVVLPGIDMRDASEEWYDDYVNRIPVFQAK